MTCRQRWARGQTKRANAETAETIGRYDNATPALVGARRTLDEALGQALLDALVSWAPRWENVYAPRGRSIERMFAASSTISTSSRATLSLR